MFDLTAEEARLLLNIALMAVGGNRFQSAAKILAVLERFRPDAPSVVAAKAVALLSAGHFAACLDFLEGETAPGRFPGNPMLSAFKGLALLRLERPAEAEAPLRLAAGQTVDPAAAQLAKGLMEHD